MVFSCSKRIRFAHCDPAGIVFYPRYAELLNEVVEDWFTDGLQLGFVELMERHRLGVPVVHLSCEFLAPARLGDRLEFHLQVKHLGNASLQLGIEAARGETVCLRAELKLVMIALQTFQATPIDEAWRQRFMRFQA
jgi:4-hydroxybenzoyl-CoA thioesterase